MKSRARHRIDRSRRSHCPPGRPPANLRGVDPELDRWLAELLKLPAEVRAALAGALLDSLEEHVDPDVEAAWAAEISRRVREVDDGQARLEPWHEVRKRLLDD